MILKIFRVSKKNPLPRYMSEGASGIDLYASLEQSVELRPGEYISIPAGVIISFPPGYEAQVRPRSGLAANYGVTILNAPGTIDSDYRGELKVILVNHGSKTFILENGMRIAQLVITKVDRADLVEVTRREDIDITERNDGGFGHTGV